MKKFVLVSLLFASSLAFADVYLQSGESSWVSGDRVHCGISEPSERRFTCTYSVCLRSDSIHHTSAHNCEFFNGYKTQSRGVWAYQGSEAIEQAISVLERDSDVADFKLSSVDCY